MEIRSSVQHRRVPFVLGSNMLVSVSHQKTIPPIREIAWVRAIPHTLTPQFPGACSRVSGYHVRGEHLAENIIVEIFT